MKSHRMYTVIILKRLGLILNLLVLLGGIFIQTAPVALADNLPESELQALNAYPNWVSNNGSACESNTTLTGSTNEQMAFNYFLGKGLSSVQTAAVVGNLMNESHLDPTIIEGGGDSNNPADSGSGGWGIAQWTPGSKIVGIAQSLNITSPIYELSTQLDIVWAEMTGTAPTGYKDVASALKQIDDLAQAVTFFQVHFESGIAGQRQLLASQALAKYGGTVVSTASTAASGCGFAGSSLSPNCQSATGNAKIVCAAEQYDPVSYEESYEGGHQGGAAWHQSCPTIGPSCVLDCSGLVNIAVYDVFGADLQQNTYSEASDTTDWQHISFSQAQPGDLIQPNTGHVEIIDHIVGNTLYTFGAHTAHAAQPDQVGPTQYTNQAEYVYLHYIGPGSQ